MYYIKLKENNKYFIIDRTLDYNKAKLAFEGTLMGLRYVCKNSIKKEIIRDDYAKLECADARRVLYIERIKNENKITKKSLY